MSKQKDNVTDFISMKLIDDETQKVWIIRVERNRWLVREKLLSRTPGTVAVCKNFDDALYYVWTHYVKGGD